jgi:antitoxin component of MazEF toxin-antitoxin module
MECVVEKVKTGHEVTIPRSLIDALGMRTGEEIRMEVVDKKLIITRTGDPIKNIRGLIKLDKETTRQVIHSPEFEPV